MNSASKVVVVGLAFFIALAVTWQATLVPTEISEPEINPGGDFIRTWAAGPLAGVAPLLVGTDVDLDGCASLDSGDTIELVPHTETSAFWMFAEPSDKVRLEWATDQVDQSILIPDSQFASESSQGRVTVTLAPRTDDAVTSVSVPRGSARICGVQDTADASGAPLAETGLITSWPVGPLAGIAPVVSDAVVDAEGCAEVAEGTTLTAVPDVETSALWVFADPSSRVRAEWRTSQLDQSSILPPEFFARDLEQGRVTVTLAGNTGDSIVTLTPARGSARVCGIQAG